MPSLSSLRQAIREDRFASEDAILTRLASEVPISEAIRKEASTQAEALVRDIRSAGNPGLMEVFLAEYGLSTDEGVALMCLAEALLRVPDTDTIDALIEDKIAPSEWGAHLGKSSSSLVNASTWALMLTGHVLREGEGLAKILRAAVKRLGEPVIRTAVARAMRELGQQFVLGQTIDEALSRGRSKAKQGYTFSYDMLGEAAMTAADAAAFQSAYAEAIGRLASEATSGAVRTNPGISIKLSALHPRYEEAKRHRVLTELVERTTALARQARAAGIGLNIDAEEADRLDLSLDVIEAVLADPKLAGWDGFGIVVQAFGKRGPRVIDWLYALAQHHDRRIMVRLVKGAYWDTEIKRAQVDGARAYPVFTRKVAADVSYIHSAAKLLSMTDRIYPQFATHNAHSVAAILAMDAPPEQFEFQRLHGMGEALHDRLVARPGIQSRIYAPVGAHRDLLAYLVRRLLENGANSSFVNQIVDESVPASEVAADPFEHLAEAQSALPLPSDLYQPERVNARGWDLTDPLERDAFEAARAPFRETVWGGATAGSVEVRNPANHLDLVGHVTYVTPEDVAQSARDARPWDATAETRAQVLNKAADLMEENAGEILALLAREAGKTPIDAVAELREAVDFFRYYAAQSLSLLPSDCGAIACISPWNFPFAIFCGQVSAALAAGNAVLAKPAEATSLVAQVAVKLMHQAGVPKNALFLLPGLGRDVGAALSQVPEVSGICFTGSTETAHAIHRSMANHLSPSATLVAETGGLNAMIVDSTALPEQAVRDIVTAAFQSAGQRCSALRVLYVQEDVAEDLLTMLYGAMDELTLGDPWDRATDIGPVIDAPAAEKIRAHVAAARREGRVLKELAAPEEGHFVDPAVLKVSGIGDLEQEIFGPVLHVATYKSHEIDDVIAAINGAGYGLTFGIHSRIDDRVEHVVSRLKVGNIYVNRNQIGAIVGSQPFGGEGLSGTGPKAGGPDYVRRLTLAEQGEGSTDQRAPMTFEALQTALDQAGEPGAGTVPVTLPGPTGESNRLSKVPRGTVLCLGPGEAAIAAQAEISRAAGCPAVLASGPVEATHLTMARGFAGVAYWGDEPTARAYRQALAARPGPILGLFTEKDFSDRCYHERHVCIDTTAAGGNASLLAEVDPR